MINCFLKLSSHKKSVTPECTDGTTTDSPKCPIAFPTNVPDIVKQCLGKTTVDASFVATDSFSRKFRLPIEYLDASDVHVLSDVVANDLELTDTHDKESKSIYACFADPKHEFAKNMIVEFKNKYTTNVEFLRDTQMVLSEMPTYKSLVESAECSQTECDKFMDLWKDTKQDPGFLEKYSFMEWDILKHLNQSSSFLQCLSFINITSPVLSLFIPVLFLVFPFILIRMRSIPITFAEYMDTLREISRNHFIGKMLNIKSLSFENIAYVGMIGFLYCLQLYQNAISCMRFYQNVKRINTHLCFMREYLEYSNKSMNAFAKLHCNKPTYAGFCQEIKKHVTALEPLCKSLQSIRPFSLNFSKMNQVGYMLQRFYQIYHNESLDAALRFSVGFEGYINAMKGISEKLENGVLGKATFGGERVTLKINLQVYPPHSISDGGVKNTCSLDKNLIITGVNASGKTTYLKTTAINVILTQQFGCGFYHSCLMQPYTHIHSYLNIPDTSGRDSLFQAESRRCKEIIDAIEVSKSRAGERHFCIFDELYSGTNPKEAVKSASSFLRYLSKRDNVDFLLTTHYVDVCKKFRKSDKVRNCQMSVKKRADGSIAYLYRLKKGISKMEGGVEILRNMNYPEEILADL